MQGCDTLSIPMKAEERARPSICIVLASVSNVHLCLGVDDMDSQGPDVDKTHEWTRWYGMQSYSHMYGKL